MTETSWAVRNHEVVTLEGQNFLNTEVSAWWLSQHELEFAGLVTEKNLASICADEQVFGNPGMASVIETVSGMVFFGKLASFEGQLAIVL